jgi:periplasmic protein TonB
MGKTSPRLSTALLLSLLCHGGALAALATLATPPMAVTQSYAVTFVHPPLPAVKPAPAAVKAAAIPPPRPQPLRTERAPSPLAPRPAALNPAPPVPMAEAAEIMPVAANLSVLPAAPARMPPALPLVVLRADFLTPPAPPAYPAAARRLGIEGTVIIRALVEHPGEPSQVTLWQSSGESLLDRSALEAVRHWRFRPMTQGGAVVAAWVEVPVTFAITNI